MSTIPKYWGYGLKKKKKNHTLFYIHQYWNCIQQREKCILAKPSSDSSTFIPENRMVLLSHLTVFTHGQTACVSRHFRFDGLLLLDEQRTAWTSVLQGWTSSSVTVDVSREYQEVSGRRQESKICWRTERKQAHCSWDGQHTNPNPETLSLSCIFVNWLHLQRNIILFLNYAKKTKNR